VTNETGRSSGRPSGSTRSSPTSTTAPRPAGRGLLPLAVTSGSRPNRTRTARSSRRTARDGRGRDRRRRARWRPDVHLSRAGRDRRSRGRRGRAGRVRPTAGARVVLGEAAAGDDVAPKPIVDRVRADGPLLPPLTVGSRAGSPSTTWRRRRWSSGRCCRRACWSGSSWSRS
jgi:hypothetical protein